MHWPVERTAFLELTVKDHLGDLNVNFKNISKIVGKR
jgi:hypothetical protein